ncbi:MAG: ferritin-like domain-containing protein [Gemmatimonadales bacterium]|nr:ferritin-like domain-containing protein [Gemmatimonadales bacterium]
MFDQLTQGLRELEFLSRLAQATNRRTFLRWSGVTMAVAAAGCGEDDDDGNGPTGPGTVSPANSTADVPPQAPPNEPLTITVRARDETSADLTTGGSDVIVEATGANASGPITAIDNGDGTYTASYTPVELGDDSIAVTIDGTAIGGSPFTISIVPEVTAVSLGSGDIGILNYAFALEQLEAAFYTTVVAAPFNGITADETQVLTDIRDHEVIHREFFRAALGPAAIPDLAVDFTSVDFTSRFSVLSTARTFEDLGVSAYNGAGFLLDSADYLLAAGKIVSVEARHAAVIRDLLEPATAAFAGDDVVNESGLDVFRLPDAVLATAATFVTTPLDSSDLPRT